MFIIHGRKWTLIKKYNHHLHPCKNCGVFDLNIKVYREYYHLFFIPLMPYGHRTVSINCNNCGYPMNMDSIKNEYESKAKTPLYLYTIPVIGAVLIAVLLYFNIESQKQKAKYIATPKAGDVYLVRKDENTTTNYYFLRLAAVRGDTIIAYHNNLIYRNFTMSLNDEDFFTTSDELFFTKKDLQRMLDDDEINAVQRDYNKASNFSRIR